MTSGLGSITDDRSESTGHRWIIAEAPEEPELFYCLYEVNCEGVLTGRLFRPLPDGPGALIKCLGAQ